MTTTLICVRHGETEWNRAGRIQGHHDSPLSERGIAQARAIGRHLAAQEWSAVVASDLGRVRATVAAMDIAPQRAEWDANLRERCFGVFEGHTDAGIAASWAEDHRRWRAVDPDHAPEGAETLRAFSERVRRASERIVARHRGGTILLVAHGGVLGVLFRQVVGVPIDHPRHFSLDNATYNRIAIDEQDRWRIEVWGQPIY